MSLYILESRENLYRCEQEGHSPYPSKEAEDRRCFLDHNQAIKLSGKDSNGVKDGTVDILLWWKTYPASRAKGCEGPVCRGRRYKGALEPVIHRVA